jgi:DNA replication protein
MPVNAKQDRAFSGFPAGKVGKILIPEPFFSDLLPLIDDLAELKVTVYCFWALQQREGEYRYVRARDMQTDNVLLAGLDADGELAQRMLHAALDRATERGTLLAVELPRPSNSEGDTLYFMNTDKGRRAVEAIERGDWTPGSEDRPVALIDDQPTIFALYEANIGPLTPLIADTLKDAESTYPYDWIAEALRIAVELNRRSWRYVEAILKRWATEGKSARSAPGNAGEPDEYMRHPYFQQREEDGE